ncbi:MAG: bifunctional (p)ppGpp synthetase/guanosine-3',5'-bis(diphosphate) 3'-pyrophosphohydrolase [Ruminococcaceae bacterium]|nr:bifunctional (p)ppGpp synthetase/guanosine-3',5'-bis(diphosphate) 3'-pyrophosphohydrolase [Oscillospiraceae bacterium]
MFIQTSDEAGTNEFAAIENLLRALDRTGKHYDIAKIQKAYTYAKELHKGQYRISGEEYISHPVAVAEIAASMALDTDSICAALLHDTVEDCGSKIDLPTLKKEFGTDVAQLVDGLTKLVQIPFEDKEEEHVENLRKMFLAMSKDVRVIFIKLCDRLHNMRTLGVKKDEKRRVTALETMQVFAPLAHRLGMQRMKHELENRSLEYLDPIGYEEIRTDIEKRYGANRNFIERARAQVSDKLTGAGIEFTLEGRVKSVYSIYRKMYQQNKSFDEIFDFYALRVIVNTEEECYVVLGLIHEMFSMVPGRFKDYISTPKPNMYRSLHTTVMGRNAIPFEVQIRTWEMHQIAEYGVAAHWKYKSGEDSKEEIDRKLSWIAKLIETEDDTRDHEEFLQALKIDIMHDEVFVFTPKGDIITLPQGATVIDFAYAIHSQVGNKMVGAKINGMIVPIDRVPQNGEIVEIITSSTTKGPSRDWMKIVRTGEARNKIRQWFKKEKRPENIAVGRSEVERELRRIGRPYTEAQKQEILLNIAKRIGIQDVDDLYNTIGYGGLTVSKIATKLKDEFERVVKVEVAPITEIDQVTTVKHKKSNGGVVVDGVDGLSVKFSKCCNPLPGDPVIGFITKGYGISIHKQDCPNVISGLNNPVYLNRWVNAYWENTASQNVGEFEAQIRITAQPDIRLIADITMALADMKVSLLGITTHTRSDCTQVELTVSCKNLDHFKSIVSRLRSVPNVEEVSRGYAT